MVSSPACIPFSKMHGAGNDFVVLDLARTNIPTPTLCRAIADRHTGVGCDLILGVAPARNAGAIASYQIWTADGLAAAQCGNGARCVAAWALRASLCSETRFSLDSPSGTHAVEVLPDGRFSVAMGNPKFDPQEIPLAGFTQEQDLYEITTRDGLTLCFAAISMGNPHAVIEVADIDEAPVNVIGPFLQASQFLPRSVNVGFAEVVSPTRIKLRVYEFGAGETKACGTGACAAVAALARRGKVTRHVAVELPGGTLTIAWDESTQIITKTGPAAFVFDGCFHLPVEFHRNSSVRSHGRPKAAFGEAHK